MTTKITLSVLIEPKLNARGVGPRVILTLGPIPHAPFYLRTFGPLHALSGTGRLRCFAPLAPAGLILSGLRPANQFYKSTLAISQFWYSSQLAPVTSILDFPPLTPQGEDFFLYSQLINCFSFWERVVPHGSSRHHTTPSLKPNHA